MSDNATDNLPDEGLGNNYDGYDTESLSDLINQAFPEGLDDVTPEDMPEDA